MTDLRNIITTKAKMTCIRDTVKYTFTAGNTASFLKGIITDVGLGEQLQKAIGLKKDKPLKSRVADTITASLLGFNNANEMHAFYDAIPASLFTKESYFHTHRHEDDVYEVYVEQGVHFTPLDAIAVLNYEFDLSRPEEMRWVSSGDLPCSLENIPNNMDMLSKSDNVAGMKFDLRPADFGDEDFLPMMEGDNVASNFEALEAYIDYAGTGQPFNRDYHDLKLGYYRDHEYEAFSVPLSAFTSKQAFIHYMLDFQEDEYGVGFTDGVSVDAILTQQDLPNSGVITLGNGFEVFYDLDKPVVILAKNKEPIFGMALYATKSDLRCKAFWEMIQK